MEDEEISDGLDSSRSNSYKSCELNEPVAIVKAMYTYGCENKYGIILDNTGRGIIEFGDDEADQADLYEVRKITKEDQEDDQYKAFLTRLGAHPFEFIPQMQGLKMGSHK